MRNAAATWLTVAINVAAVGAITFNGVEDFEHPFVGLLVLYDINGEFQGRCSGSLLTPHVFLTAGHCVGNGANSARIYFQQDAGAHYDPVTQHDPVTGYPDECAAGTLGVTCATGTLRQTPFFSDVGLVILDQPIPVSEYGALAASGSLGELATRRGQQELTFTASGYGVSYINPVKIVSLRERLMASQRLVNLFSHLTGGFYLQTADNPGIGGGTCGRREP